MTLQERIAAADKNTPPDELRELDARIHCWRRGYKYLEPGDHRNKAYCAETPDGRTVVLTDIPFYMVDINAAANLMPEGWDVEIYREANGKTKVKLWHEILIDPDVPEFDWEKANLETGARVLAAMAAEEAREK